VQEQSVDERGFIASAQDSRAEMHADGLSGVFDGVRAKDRLEYNSDWIREAGSGKAAHFR
jgi:hypothetical protein